MRIPTRSYTKFPIRRLAGPLVLLMAAMSVEADAFDQLFAFSVGGTPMQGYQIGEGPDNGNYITCDNKPLAEGLLDKPAQAVAGKCPPGFQQPTKRIFEGHPPITIVDYPVHLTERIDPVDPSLGDFQVIQGLDHVFFRGREIPLQLLENQAVANGRIRYVAVMRNGVELKPFQDFLFSIWATQTIGATNDRIEITRGTQSVLFEGTLDVGNRFWPPPPTPTAVKITTPVNSTYIAIPFEFVLTRLGMHGHWDSDNEWYVVE